MTAAVVTICADSVYAEPQRKAVAYFSKHTNTVLSGKLKSGSH